MIFEIKKRDIAGRIGILKIKNKKIETPLLLPVINPNKPIITPREIQKEFKHNAIITNAYIIFKNKELREKALDKGIHSLLNFDGIIETDSGSYQMLHYKKNIEVSNEKIVEFQIYINSDIVNVLDIPTDIDASYEEALRDLKITIERIKEGLKLKEDFNYDGLINGAVQGGIFIELRKKAAEEVSKLPVDIYAIGTIVPYLISYKYKELFQLILEARINLPLNKPVHLFGLGHPLILPLSVAIGSDIFDSASYALYAYDERIITPFRTFRLSELNYFVFETPKKIYYLDEIKQMPKEERIKIIAKHNLYQLLKEIELIKDAISNQYLWELVLAKAHLHYSIYKATKFVLTTYYRWLKRLDPVRKKTGILYRGDLLELRTDIKRSLERLKERVSEEDIDSLFEYVYPFKDLKDEYR